MESIFKIGILLSVLDAVTGPATKIGKGMDTLRGKAASLGPVFDRFKTYGLRVATAGALMMHFLSGTVMATTASQSALGELSSVGIQDLGALERAGTQFSNQWSGTTKAQFISAAYDIKSGISSLTDTGVAEFTKLAALTGKATKSSTAEMTSLFATGYGIYKNMYADLTDMQFGEVFSAGISASVKNFKTTGSGMAQAISTLGATATTAKIPLQEQLTILGMLQATMSGSEAGTKYKALMQAAAGAGQKLNLQFMDSNNQLLSMPEILNQLKGRYGSTLDAIEKMEIQKAFGTQEAVAVIDLLYGKIDALTDNTRSLSAAMRQGTTFTEQMASAMNQDIGKGISLLGQQWHNLVEVIGKQLIPVLSPLFSVLGKIIIKVTQFADTHGAFTRAVVISVAVVSTLAFGIGSLVAVLGVIGLMVPNAALGITQMGMAYGFVKTSILKAIPALKFWVLWQKQALLTFLYQQGGLRAYALTIIQNLIPSIWSATKAGLAWTGSLLTKMVPGLGTATAATKAWTVAQYKALAASIKNAGGIRAWASGINRSLLPSIWAAIKAGLAWAGSLLKSLVPSLWAATKAGLVWAGSLLTKLVPILGAATASVWSFTVALLANPVMIVVSGITVLIAIIAVLYKKFSWAQTAVDSFMYAIGYMIGTLVKARKGFIDFLCNPILTMKALWWGAGEVVYWLIDKFMALFPVLKTVAKVMMSLAFPPLAFVFDWSDLKKGVRKIFDFLAGIDFFKPGVRIITTFVEGIKSKVAAPVEAVRAGFSKLRNLLPFSDAKEGPLSQLTLSGSRIMDTLGAGIKAQAPALRNTLQGALAGAAMVVPQAAIETPEMPDIKATAAYEAVTPKAPDIVTRAVYEAVGPVVPDASDIAAKAVYENVDPIGLKVPDIGAKAIYETICPISPDVPDVIASAMWKNAGVDIPSGPDLSYEKLQAETGSTVTVKPEKIIKKIIEKAAPSTTHIMNKKFHIENVNLPGVSDGDSFIRQLQELEEKYGA